MTKLSFREELVLASLKYPTVCPHCGRAVLITPKDMFYRMGMHGIKDDIPFKVRGHWCYQCKCEGIIKFNIMLETIDEDEEK